MLIKQPPTISVSTHHTCTYHMRHPGKPYAGCTCGSTFMLKVKPRSEWTEAEVKQYFGDMYG